MGLSVQLMKNSSPNEKLNKVLSDPQSFTCLLKDTTDILNPVLDLQAVGDLSIYNYMYIEDFGRYYFIDKPRSLHNNMWRISAHVDVLQTYNEKIKNNSAIIKGTQGTGMNKYLSDNDVFVMSCKHRTNIVNFPYGLSDTGEFILITAGG